MSTTNFLTKLTWVLLLFGFATSSFSQSAKELKAADQQLKTDIAMYEKVWHEIVNERKIDQINTEEAGFQSLVNLFLI